VFKIPKSLIIVVAVVMLGAIGYFGYLKVKSWNQEMMDSALKKEREKWEQKTQQLEEEIAALEEKIESERQPPVPEEKIIEAFGKDAVTAPPDRQPVSCQRLERQIRSFCAYLDDKRYIAAHNLESGTYRLFIETVEKLTKNPPMVTAEMKDLISLTRNLAHFNRVLGKEPIELFKDVLENESEIVESAMANFFAWFDGCDRCAGQLEGCPSLTAAYEYAGFFLNTVAGRSYLLRRNSKVRILTSYYCVLILDMANTVRLNRYGIDIRPYIDYAFYDISNYRGLIYREKYLSKVEVLRKKYEI
jgi:hypothetical protein